jgi:hypothetical protein
MHRRSVASVLLCLSLSLSARADDAVTRFHYMDLYNIQHSASSMEGLQGLRVDVYVTSTRPGVRPQDITLTLHRASGALEPLEHDAYGHTLLPESDALKAENPLIVTNQPKHSLNASVVIDLVPPPSTDLAYTALMLGLTQLNGAIAQQKLGALAKLYGHQANGLLVFYNYGDHSLILHRQVGDQVLKSGGPDKLAAHLKAMNTALFTPGMQIIYVPLDAGMLKENPRVTLDAPPAQIFPAF